MERVDETYAPIDELTIVYIDQALPLSDFPLPPDLAKARVEDAKRIAKFKLSMTQNYPKDSE